MSLGSTWTASSFVLEIFGAFSFIQPKFLDWWKSPIPWHIWIIIGLVCLVIGIIETNFGLYRKLESKIIPLLEVATTNQINTAEHISAGKREALVHSVILYLKNPNEQEKTVNGIGVSIISDHPQLGGKKIPLNERPPYRTLNLNPGQDAAITLASYVENRNMPWFSIPNISEYGDTYQRNKDIQLDVAEEYQIEFMVSGEDLSARMRTLIFGVKDGKFYAHWKHLMTQPAPDIPGSPS